MGYFVGTFLKKMWKIKSTLSATATHKHTQTVDTLVQLTANSIVRSHGHSYNYFKVPILSFKSLFG